MVRTRRESLQNEQQPVRVTRATAKRAKEESQRGQAQPTSNCCSLRCGRCLLLLVAVMALGSLGAYLWGDKIMAEISPFLPEFLLNDFPVWMSDLIQVISEGRKFVTPCWNYIVEIKNFLRTLDADVVKGHIFYLPQTYGVGVYLVAFLFVSAIIVFLVTHSVWRGQEKIETIKESSKARNMKVVAKCESEAVGTDDEMDELEDDLLDDDDKDGGEYVPLEGPGQVLMYADRKTKDEYEKEGETETVKELAKLLRSREFIELVNEKGNEDSAYNWQKRRSARLAKNAEKTRPPATR